MIINNTFFLTNYIKADHILISRNNPESRISRKKKQDTTYTVQK